MEETPQLFDSERILATWESKGTGGFGAQEVWDASAADYVAFPLPTFEEDPFLRMVAEEVPLDKDMTVLDIGCGSGIYGIALAERVGQVTGCDLSPKMIEAARAKAREEGCANIRFVQGDFRSMAFGETYDLVFAHLTPAVCDGETFRKMTDLACRWCFVAKPVRRTDAVLYEARRRAGVPAMEDARDEDFLRAFAAVWLQGGTPTVRHYADVWDTERPVGEAMRLYCEKLVALDLDERQKAVVRAYVESVAEEGVVREHIETIVAMMGWRV